jgi:hypothetical protein
MRISRQAVARAVLLLGALLLGHVATMLVFAPADAAGLLRNGSFEAGGRAWDRAWTFRNDLGATLARDGTTRVHGAYSLRVDVVSASTAYLVQLRQPGFALVAGRTYRLAFWARASAARPIDVALQEAAAPWTLYFKRSVALGTSWRPYVLGYTAAAAQPNATLNFDLAAEQGQVWLDAVSLEEVP